MARRLVSLHTSWVILRTRFAQKTTQCTLAPLQARGANKRKNNPMPTTTSKCSNCRQDYCPSVTPCKVCGNRELPVLPCNCYGCRAARLLGLDESRLCQWPMPVIVSTYLQRRYGGNVEAFYYQHTYAPDLLRLIFERALPERLSDGDRLLGRAMFLKMAERRNIILQYREDERYVRINRVYFSKSRWYANVYDLEARGPRKMFVDMVRVGMEF